jgi:hypothetical protein
MRSTAKELLAWRGLPIFAALLMACAAAGFIACDDTGPSPIGDHAPDDVDSGSSGKPAQDAGEEASADDDDAGDAGEDSGEEDSGMDAGKDADASKDAGKDADAH